MTTFLLHGGATSQNIPGNEAFFAQFTKLIDKEAVNVLLCYWARPLDEWEKLAHRDSEIIMRYTSKSVEFTVAQDSDELFSKIDACDVIYVAGGKAELLEPFYQELEPLKYKLSGKVYAGSSMGAFLASKNYILSYDSQDTSSVHHGLGLLPIQILCHWDVEKNKEMKLKLLNNEIPTIVLNEGEFVTIYRK